MRAQSYLFRTPRARGGGPPPAPVPDSLRGGKASGEASDEPESRCDGRPWAPAVQVSKLGAACPPRWLRGAHLAFPAQGKKKRSCIIRQVPARRAFGCRGCGVMPGLVAVGCGTQFRFYSVFVDGLAAFSAARTWCSLSSLVLETLSFTFMTQRRSWGHFSSLFRSLFRGYSSSVCSFNFAVSHTAPRGLQLSLFTLVSDSLYRVLCSTGRNHRKFSLSWNAFRHPVCAAHSSLLLTQLRHQVLQEAFWEPSEGL